MKAVKNPYSPKENISKDAKQKTKAALLPSQLQPQDLVSEGSLHFSQELRELVVSEVERYWFNDGVNVPDLTHLFLSKSFYDTMWLDGKQIPGLVAVKKGTISTRLEMYQPKGMAKARYEYSGYNGATIEVEVLLAGRAVWHAFEKMIIPLVRIQNSTDLPTPISVTHPMLNLHNIHSVFVKQYEIPTKLSDTGELYVTRLTLLEDLPVRWKVTEKMDSGSGANTASPGKLLAVPGLQAAAPAFGSNAQPPSPDQRPTTGWQSQKINTAGKNSKKQKSTTTTTKTTVVVTEKE